MYKNSIDGIISFSDRQTAESEIIILDNKRNLISTEPTENQTNFNSRTSSNINTNYNVKIMNIITGTVAKAVIHLQPSVGMTISATTTIKVDPSAQKNWKQTKTL